MTAGYVEVNETRVLMTGATEITEWWLLYEQRAHAAGRVTEVGPQVMGGRKRIVCDTADDACELADHLIARGLPKSAVRANGPTARGMAGRNRSVEGGGGADE